MNAQVQPITEAPSQQRATEYGTWTPHADGTARAYARPHLAAPLENFSGNCTIETDDTGKLTKLQGRLVSPSCGMLIEYHPDNERYPFSVTFVDDKGEIIAEMASLKRTDVTKSFGIVTPNQAPAKFSM